MHFLAKNRELVCPSKCRGKRRALRQIPKLSSGQAGNRPESVIINCSTRVCTSAVAELKLDCQCDVSARPLCRVLTLEGRREISDSGSRLEFAMNISGGQEFQFAFASPISHACARVLAEKETRREISFWKRQEGDALVTPSRAA